MFACVCLYVCPLFPGCDCGHFAAVFVCVCVWMTACVCVCACLRVCERFRDCL